MPPTTHKLLLSISSLLKTLWSGVHLKRSSMSKHVKLWHTVGNKPQSTKRHERAKEHKSEEKSHLTKMGRGVSDAGLKSKGERNRPTQNIYKCTIDIMTPKKRLHIQEKQMWERGIWETRSRQAGWNTKGTGVTKSW